MIDDLHKDGFIAVGAEADNEITKLEHNLDGTKGVYEHIKNS